MIRIAIPRALAWCLVTLALVGCFAAVAIAQQTAVVEKGEVVYVSGNDVVVKMENGEVRHFTAPPGATAVVDGKTITVKDLKPGMKLARTTITTTTQKTVRSVRTVTGKVWQVNAPYVTFTGADGKNKRVKVPDGTKFNIDGSQMTVFDLKPGMTFTATVVSDSPETVVSSKKSVSGTAPPPPVVAEIPAKIEPVFVIEEVAPAPPPPPPAAAPAPEPAAAPAPEPAKLPKTGSPVPLVGMMGLGLTLSGLAMRFARKR